MRRFEELCTKQAVLLMGQTNNIIYYHCRVSVLSSLSHLMPVLPSYRNQSIDLQINCKSIDCFYMRATLAFNGLMNPPKAKSMLKGKATVKGKKQSKELFYRKYSRQTRKQDPFKVTPHVTRL